LRIPAYLQRNRFGIYQFRRAVPPRLRPAIGKTEIIRSLGTREPREALRLARILAYHIDNLFTESEAHMAGRDTDFLRLDYTVEISLPDGTKSVTTTTPEDIAALKEAGLSPEQITSLLMPQPLTSSGVEKPLNIAAAPNSPTPPGLRLSELVEAYNADRVAMTDPSWKVPPGDITKFRRLIEILGDCPCNSITRQTARNVRDTLARLPKDASKFRGQTVNEILKLKHPQTLSAETIKDYIGLYSSLFGWARRENFYDGADPFDGIAPNDSTPRNQKRSPFTLDDLEKIFSGDMFMSFDPTRHKPHHYWAPLIALHSGARNAEIGALEVTDLKQVQDGEQVIWVIDINTEAEKKRVKTPNAIRQIPVHEKLVELGLIDYRDQLAKHGQNRLFPYLKWDEKSGYGRYIGENFNNYLKDIGIYEHIRKVFYSFRHTIATALERQDVQIHRIEQLSGRTLQGFKPTGQQFYISPAESIHLYHDLMKVSFEDQLKRVKRFSEMVDSNRLGRHLKRLSAK